MPSQTGYSKIVNHNLEQFELRLGDLMRGERAAKGKSLLDVQRELKIKASFIAAIENADPDAFDTPSFVPGYVRSYARYLGMEPDRAYEAFCAESGFNNDYGMPLEKSANSRGKPVNRFESVRRSLNLMSRAKKFAKAVLFVLFYPTLIMIDLAIRLTARITTREAGSSLSFQGVNPETTDWWTFFAVFAGGTAAVLVWFSEFALFVNDWASRALISLGIGACVTMALAWFNPRMFFARLTLALLVPIFLSSLFGVEISMDANGNRFGGLVNFGTDTDPVTTIVVGLLCALAMIFHGRRS